jgi:hypothetical protein
MAGTIVSTICANRVLDLPDTTADLEIHPDTDDRIEQAQNRDLHHGLG